MAKKILIADDEPPILMMLESRLQANDFEVITAENGQIALDQAREHQPDLIILDVNMPPPNGFQVCRTLKDDPDMRKTPIILLTAKSTDSDKFWGTESGADAYVTKPYNPEELMQTVQSLLTSNA